jgi:hypothetical protein
MAVPSSIYIDVDVKNSASAPDDALADDAAVNQRSCAFTERSDLFL